MFIVRMSDPRFLRLLPSGRAVRPGLPRSSEMPAGSRILATEKAFGFGPVRDLHVVAVPLDLAARSIGDVAEVVRFGQGRSVVEGAAGRCALLAGIEPLE